jgi:citrate lyase beta subunit
MRIRRALLFIPGHDRRKCEKGATLGADSVVMDLEDGVALSHKAAARATIAGMLRDVDFGATERLVRINPVGGDLWEEDLDQTLEELPDGYVIPKVDNAGQISAVAGRLSAAENARDLPRGTLRLLALVETALGIVNLREIAASSPRLDALILGGEDLASDLGAARTETGAEIAYARAAIAMHARAFGLQPVDTIYVTLDDVGGLERETESARGLGFTGKLAIHPRQVQPIQRVFTPGREEIERAMRLIDIFDERQAAGVGVFEFEGKMVDMPMVRAARAVVARARAAGALGE